MPTAKPRLQITLDPDDYQFFKQFGEMQGIPAASLISKYLHQAIPVLRKLATVMQEVQRVDFSVMTDEQRQRLVSELEAVKDDGQSALVMMGGAAKRVDAALPRARSARRGSQSLIHTNKSPKSMPVRVPAAKAQQKRGGKRAST